MSSTVMHIVGARPNFMKVAPVMRALEKYRNISQLLVHTGQHYDENMSDIFFKQLDIPMPDINLEVGSGSHATQTADTMVKLESTMLDHSPSVVIVYGDINSTLAATIVASKLCIKLVHVEAGLRSNDRTMPEEINRLVTDRLADLLLTPSKDADRNLLEEGVKEPKIHCVGNIMIDTLLHLKPHVRKPEIDIQERYFLATLHRPSNVDDPKMLKRIITTLNEIASQTQIILPVHPRTKDRMRNLGLLDSINPGLTLTQPLGYLEFLYLQINSIGVITDSGGIQEESTFLKIPCLTLRQNTERPVTVDIGSNTLIGNDMELLKLKVTEILSGSYQRGNIPEFWDGKTGERIAEVINNFLSTGK